MLKVKTLYDSDFNVWLEAQVEALKAQRLEDLDLPNLIEEMESLAKHDKRALRSHLKVLLMHLLKWQFQPDKRSNSWEASISNARIEIEDILSDSPSLKNYLSTVLDRAYANARTLASTETGLVVQIFPEVCPYPLSQALALDFLPES
ncbi:MAG: DUF29 domain-containing protein [Phormidesmis sp.]